MTCNSSHPPTHAGNGRLEFIGGFHREFVAKRWSERRKAEGASPAELELLRAAKMRYIRLLQSEH